jgi:general secretion pathway protein A
MYQGHFKLKAKPFQITVDPRFLWLGEKHSEALATLKYGILENKGFLLLTGNIGTGKTALIKRLVKMIDVAAIVATIPDPGLEAIDFFNILSVEFGMKRQFESKGAFLISFKEFLYKAFDAKKKVLLIVDEAQRLSPELLEQIRLLSNIEMDNRKLINIFFVGQSEFYDLLQDERNKAVRQRISAHYHIKPLTVQETDKYIRHRLKVAGVDKEIFSPQAVREIFAFSQGYPRLINIICDHALLTAYAAGLHTIDIEIIKECETELHIPIDIETKDPEEKKVVAAKDKLAVTDLDPPKNQSTGKVIAILVFITILVAVAGYFLIEFGPEDKPRWSMEEIAPQKYDVLPSGETEFAPAETVETTEKQAADVSPPPAAQTTEKAVVAKEVENESAAVKPVAPTDETPKAMQNVAPFPEKKIVIYFKRNSNEIPESAIEILDRIAEFMIQSPDAHLNINGYTDSIGSRSYNISVSQFRTNSIKSYLVGKGVASTNIKAVGLGPENPIDTNETAEGRRRNRRVEIELNLLKNN